ADAHVHFLSANLENPMVFAGAFSLISVVVMVALSAPSPHPMGREVPVPGNTPSPHPMGRGPGRGVPVPVLVKFHTGWRLSFALITIAFILWLAAVSPSAVAMVVLIGTLV